MHQGHWGAGRPGASIPKMLKALVPGDVMTVTRIDRLARSTCDLFAIVNQNEGGQGFRNYHNGMA
jgi:DNA invertase Pin-like site-specific DNA recombinase